MTGGWKTIFRPNRRMQAGMLTAAFLLWLLAAGIYVKRMRYAKTEATFTIDSTASRRLDSLFVLYDSLTRPRLYPFNPNYISDYRAYVWGIPDSSLKKIRAYRASGKYFRSKEEFKRIARLPDTLYERMAPYLRIPRYASSPRASRSPSSSTRRTDFIKSLPKKDINTATREELMKVYGIGPVLSNRIIKYREKLGGFTIREQLLDIYALTPEAYENLWKYFDIKTPKPISRTINVNTALMQELQENPYIDFDLSEKIVEYRTLHGPFRRLEDLKKVPGFPADKYKRIVLYLRLK
ncbi:MAG: helix-hairpin-helix domain-containing protein [Chlorobi bacterium]|nr:helix-hairpin-helix domain-containing protein [Chlorobiota bacterium]